MSPHQVRPDGRAFRPYRLLRASAWLTAFAALCLTTGCAQFDGLLPAMSAREHQSLDTKSLIRSQDQARDESWSTESDDWSASSGASDDESPRSTSARYGSPRGSEPDAQTDSDVFDPGSDSTASSEHASRQPARLIHSGHSVAIPRATLGRPIPQQTTAPDASATLDNAGPSRPGASAMSFVSPWQSAAMAPDTSSELTEPSAPSATAETTLAESANELPGAADVTDSVDPSMTIQPQFAPSAGELNTSPNAAAAAPTAPTADSPSVLDRLRRGLAPPRLEDNTDKLRRQMRRWQDPFGLLKDRDTPDSAAATPAPSTPDPVTSELNTAAAPGATATSDVMTSTVPVAAASPLESAITLLELELAEWPRDAAGRPERPAEWRRRQSDLRLMYLVADRPAEAVRVIEALSPAEQEFWQSLLLAVSSCRSAQDALEGSPEVNLAVDQLRSAQRRLQPLATLALPRVLFCDRIDGFGQVSQYPSADFDPGQRLLVYAEIRNFQSQLTDDASYRSEFKAELEFLRDGDDEVLQSIKLPSIVDECASERTDYFHTYELTVPALSGRYQLRLELQDQVSGQVTESRLEFTVR
jgi:hypothetical protein